MEGVATWVSTLGGSRWLWKSTVKVKEVQWCYSVGFFGRMEARVGSKAWKRVVKG